MVGCVNKQSNLVDFNGCSRTKNLKDGGKVRDITDWPTDARDGYQMTNIRCDRDG